MDTDNFYYIFWKTDISSYKMGTKFTQIYTNFGSNQTNKTLIGIVEDWTGLLRGSGGSYLIKREGGKTNGLFMGT